MSANAQKKVIRGQVKDASGKYPISGALIYMANGHNPFADTNDSGYYTITVVNPGDTLVCSKFGYLTKYERIEGNNTINFFLPAGDTFSHTINLFIGEKKEKKKVHHQKNNDNELGFVNDRFRTRFELPSDYKGGNKALDSFFIKKIMSVNEIQENIKPGCIKIRLYINKKGIVTNVVLIKGIDTFLDEEVIKAAYQSCWRPAIQNGRCEESLHDLSFCFL